MKNIDAQAWIAALTMGAGGAFFGKYVIIVIAAVGGSLVALSRMKGQSRVEGAMFIFRSVMFATALTGLGIWLINQWKETPESVLLFPLAFFIALIGDGWFDIKDKLVEMALKGKKDNA